MVERTLLTLVLVLVCWVAPSAAQGLDPLTAIVTTTDGGTVVGALVEDLPGQYVTVLLVTGEVRRIEYDTVVNVKLVARAAEATGPTPPPEGSAPDTATPPTPPPEGSAPETARDASATPDVTTSVDEARRTELIESRPSLRPASLMLVGGLASYTTGVVILAVTIGRCLFTDDAGLGCEFGMVMGLAHGVAGVASTVTGVGMFVRRAVVRGRIRRELNRLDARSTAVSFDIAPFSTREFGAEAHAPTVFGAGAGIAAHGQALRDLPMLGPRAHGLMLRLSF